MDPIPFLSARPIGHISFDSYIVFYLQSQPILTAEYAEADDGSR